MLDKIFATIHSIADEAKGPSNSVRQLYSAMVKAGNQITLVDADYSSSVNLPDFSKSFPSGHGPAKLGRSPQMYNFLNEQAKAGQIKLLHNHGIWMMPNVYPGQIASKYNIPLVTSPRGTFADKAWHSGSKFKHLFWRFYQKPALVPTVCFHATAFSEYEDIRRMGYRQPVAVIPNGIEIPSGYTKQPQQLKTLLFVGRIHPIKGLDMLLTAWQCLESSFPDWQLKIVGPNSNGYLEELQKLKHHLKLMRVSFTGPMYGSDKWQEYHNADLTVLPTNSENFAMSVAESLACGIPAVVTKGAPWAGLEQNNCGLWVDINSGAIAEGLSKMMMQGTETLSMMGLNGKNWMINEFSWEQLAQQMEQLYSWILNNGDKPQFVYLD